MKVGFGIELITINVNVMDKAAFYGYHSGVILTMIAVYNPDNYSNILEALEAGGVYYTASFIDNDYTAVADCYEAIVAVERCLGSEVKAYYTHDEKTFVPIDEYLEILSQYASRYLNHIETGSGWNLDLKILF